MLFRVLAWEPPPRQRLIEATKKQSTGPPQKVHADQATEQKLRTKNSVKSTQCTVNFFSVFSRSSKPAIIFHTSPNTLVPTTACNGEHWIPWQTIEYPPMPVLEPLSSAPMICSRGHVQRGAVMWGMYKVMGVSAAWAGGIYEILGAFACNCNEDTTLNNTVRRVLDCGEEPLDIQGVSIFVIFWYNSILVKMNCRRWWRRWPRCLAGGPSPWAAHVGVGQSVSASSSVFISPCPLSHLNMHMILVGMLRGWQQKWWWSWSSKRWFCPHDWVLEWYYEYKWAFKPLTCSDSSYL